MIPSISAPRYHSIDNGDVKCDWWWHWRNVVDNLITMRRRRRPCLLVISPLLIEETLVVVVQAKIETRALKAKRPGFTDERYSETEYYFENGESYVFYAQLPHPCPPFSSCVCIWGACATTPDGVFQTVRFALIESNFLFFFSSLKRYRLGGKDPSLPLLWRPSYVEPTVKRDFVRGFSSDDGCYDAIGAERLGGQWSLLSHRVDGRRRGWR